VEEERSAPPNGRDLELRLARAAAVLTWIFAVGWLLLGNVPLAVWVLSRRPLPVFPIIGEVNNGAFYYWFSYRVFGYLSLASVPLGVAEVLAARALWRGERRGAAQLIWLFPLEIATWIGFAWPIPPLLGVARFLLILRAWPQLKPSTVRIPARHSVRRRHSRTNPADAVGRATPAVPAYTTLEGEATRATEANS
jgi:hypothetical protein